MIYALIFVGGGLYDLVEHEDSTKNLDLLEKTFNNLLPKKKRTEDYRTWQRRRVKEANTHLTAPRTEEKLCFIQWLIEKHGFKNVEYKKCEVMC